MDPAVSTLVNPYPGLGGGQFRRAEPRTGSDHFADPTETHRIQIRRQVARGARPPRIERRVLEHEMVGTDPTAGNSVPPESRKPMAPAVFGSLLLLNFVLVIVMLVTDKNLQTDFGAQTSGNYLHWYAGLGMGVLDLLLGLGLLASTFQIRGRLGSASTQRYMVMGALVWTILVIIASVAVVETYSQVRFTSEGQFSQYLFGTSAYPGALSYIPWLYDLLLATYVISALAGIAAIASVRTKPAVPSAS
jgi:hypothetical protein